MSNPTLLRCAMSRAVLRRAASVGHILLAGILSLCLVPPAFAQAAEKVITVTLLGTGTPDPRIERFGPSTLVEAGGKRLLFDVGRGATMRLQQIGVSLGRLTAVFLTHYHSDHTNGIPDLWLTGWLPPHG